MRQRFDLRTTLTLAALALFVALPLPGLMRYQGPAMEEGFMLAFPQRILAGELPHVDFLHLYGPGSLYVLAAVYKVFGSYIEVERTVGMLQHIVVIVAMFWFARPWGRVVALGSALISMLIIITPTGLNALAWNGALALTMAGIALVVPALERGGRVRIGCAGLLFGVALLYRPDMILGVGLTAVVAWIMLGRSEQARPARRVGLATLIATCLLYVPFILAVGLDKAFEGMFLQPVFDLRAGRRLPVPPTWSEPDGLLQRAGYLRESAWPFPMLDIGAQVNLWFWLLPASVLFVLVGTWWSVRRRPERIRPRVLALGAAFSLGLLPQGFQRPDTAHLSWVSCVSFALVPLVILELWSLREPVQETERAPVGVRVRQGVIGLVPAVRAALARPVVALLPIAAVLVGVIPFYPAGHYVDLVGQTFGRRVFGEAIERDGRRFYTGDADTARDAQRIVDELERRSSSGERLIVGPFDLAVTPYSDAFFFYLFPELDPGTRYIEMDPGLANAHDSGLAEELLDNDWLILSDVWSNWDEPNTSRDRGDERPNEIVAEHYCEVLELEQYRLLQWCGD